MSQLFFYNHLYGEVKGRDGNAPYRNKRMYKMWKNV